MFKRELRMVLSYVTSLNSRYRQLYWLCWVDGRDGMPVDELQTGAPHKLDGEAVKPRGLE